MTQQYIREPERRLLAPRVYDVAVLGGGPAGSTLGTLLKKYAPTLEVAIVERERFPRDHVGESQLPPISAILDEMGCWDKVEAAGCPIKIGATYRWGQDPALWDFEFLPLSEFKTQARPGRYEGARRRTAFQVDRARYDKILLDHAAELGCVVMEETAVERIAKTGDRVMSLELSDGGTVEARHYVDASGSAGILRRAMEVGVEVPTSLMNIAIWDYWENADWAVEIGVGGTRVQVLSIGTGWFWFIPLSPTRTSIGFVCPAAYFRASGKSAEELYREALPKDGRLQSLIANARPEGRVRVTKDWSFLASRMTGENWFLAGEAGGFADPILAAGMTLAQAGAREAAYTILELERGSHDTGWLRRNYDETQRRRIGQHIRFADFWYAANGQFTDLQAYTAQIAKDAGLQLSPQDAFQWLGTGGFINDVLGQAGIGGLDLAGVKQVAGRFLGANLQWELSRFNVFRLTLDDATADNVPVYREGRILTQRSYRRGSHMLPVIGMYALVIEALRQAEDVATILKILQEHIARNAATDVRATALQHALQAMEVMLAEGWIAGSLDETKPRIGLSSPREGVSIHTNRDPPRPSRPI